MTQERLYDKTNGEGNHHKGHQYKDNRKALADKANRQETIEKLRPASEKPVTSPYPTVLKVMTVI